MKPQDLDDRAPIEPDDQLLASTTRGAGRFAGAGAQRFTSVTAGLVVLALASGIAWTRIDTNNNRQITLPAATSTTTSDADVSRTPSWASGDRCRSPVTTAHLQGSLSFDGRGGRWTGSDGCNDYTGGTYGLDGNELAGSAVRTETRCDARLGCPANPGLRADRDCRSNRGSRRSADVPHQQRERDRPLRSRRRDRANRVAVDHDDRGIHDVGSRRGREQHRPRGARDRVSRLVRQSGSPMPTSTRESSFRLARSRSRFPSANRATRCPYWPSTTPAMPRATEDYNAASPGEERRRCLRASIKRRCSRPAPSRPHRLRST